MDFWTFLFMLTTAGFAYLWWESWGYARSCKDSVKKAEGDRDKVAGERDLLIREMEAMGRRLAGKDQEMAEMKRDYAAKVAEANRAYAAVIDNKIAARVEELRGTVGEASKYFKTGGGE